MKKVTTLFLIAVSALLFVACGDKSDGHIKSFMFVGTFSSQISDSEMTDISCQTTFDSDKGTCEITLWTIRFSPKQAHLYNFCVRGLKVQANDSDTIITGSNLVPEFSVDSYSEGSLDFMVKELNATIKDGHISYKATVRKSSNDLDLFFEGNKK